MYYSILFCYLCLLNNMDMKKLFFALVALLLSSVMMAGSLVKISYDNCDALERLFSDKNLTVHYYSESQVYATAEVFDPATMVLLDENAFDQNEVYTLVYCPKDEQSRYIADYHLQTIGGTDYSILVKGPAMPYKNDGAVAIFNKKASLPRLDRDFPVVTEVDPRIRAMMDQVNMDSLQATVQHLQDYNSRIWNSSNAFTASDWIAGRMEALGLEVEQQPFYANTWTGSGQAAPNVIGIQRGTLYPNTYVVCGSHFDSFSWEAMYGGGSCPGADDNATGVASVLESARIMSQYEFEYSIVYCAYGCEEMGLYGSEAYASRCQQQGMDIIGYFNNDMNGYLYGDQIHIDLIYPNSVEPIGSYYMNVANVYYPEMPVRHVNFTQGDSDHTSFNNHGYMGIYPFEDYQHYSPNIHTPQDLIGPSVNSFGMSQRYCQMNIGCLAEIANPLGGTPEVLCHPVTYFHFEYPNPGREVSHVTLVWNAPEPGSTGTCLRYEVYRDGVLRGSVPNDNYELFGYRDDINVDEHVMYYVKAVYDDGCEADSETLEAIGVPNQTNEAFEVDATVYPNPVEGELIVKAEGLQRVVVYNVMGQQVASVETKESECTLAMDAYPQGFYTLKLVTRNGLVTKNVVVK